MGVHDGDTITLLDAENRPSTRSSWTGSTPPSWGQPFGRASKQHLAELLANREAVAECSKIDRYRREVCRVLVGGADAGLEQVRAGLVLQALRQGAATGSTPAVRRHGSAGQGRAARALWADAEPVAPWDWRAATVRK